MHEIRVQERNTVTTRRQRVSSVQSGGTKSKGLYYIHVAM